MGIAGRVRSWITWLETHWVVPAYAGGVLLGLTMAFFGAAVNTMSGWLYVISGVMIALLLVGSWSPPRGLRQIRLYRQPTPPISVGETLAMHLELHNHSNRPLGLLQIRDHSPPSLGASSTTAIAVIPAGKSKTWTYSCQPQRRGLYHWDTISLRTAAPLGLFWCRRLQPAPAQVTIYPQILPLRRCPLIDQLGLALGSQWQAARQPQMANEGLTRALRPYRWGDPTRLIHWRTSARYGELRVRELEQLTADNQVVIGLDTVSDRWSEATFESAVTAAASLYIYSLRRQLPTALWLPHSGTVHRKHAVLSALAAVMPESSPPVHRIPTQTMIWLSPTGTTPPPLAAGSVGLYWQEGQIESTSTGISERTPDGVQTSTWFIDVTASLIQQLQSNGPVG